MLVNKGFAQDVEQSIKSVKTTLKEDPLAVTGSIGASSVFYRAYGIAPRRDPFYWIFNANMNVTLFNKVSVPFTAVITQRTSNTTPITK